MSSISVRYMIDDVPAAIEFYTTHLGFAVDLDASPAFESVSRDGVRLLLSGKTSSGRRAMPDGREPALAKVGGLFSLADRVARLGRHTRCLSGAVSFPEPNPCTRPAPTAEPAP